MAEFVIFFLMATVALGAAIGMVLARNPVHAALLLVTVLIAIAVMFLLEDAQLLAAVQVIVYAGAIVVLFLFVIMLLGVDKHESLRDPVRSQRPAAIVLGCFGVAAVPEGSNIDSLVAAADDALYRAKRSGKNRVVSAADVVSR